MGYMPSKIEKSTADIFRQARSNGQIAILGLPSPIFGHNHFKRVCISGNRENCKKLPAMPFETTASQGNSKWFSFRMLMNWWITIIYQDTLCVNWLKTTERWKNIAFFSRQAKRIWLQTCTNQQNTKKNMERELDLPHHKSGQAITTWYLVQRNNIIYIFI